MSSETGYAVNVRDGEAMNNPLLLLRVLDYGASLGESVDLDKSHRAAPKANLGLL